MSTGEYDSTQFYIVFIATVFSGEAAASFFQYTTSELPREPPPSLKLRERARELTVAIA